MSTIPESTGIEPVTCSVKEAERISNLSRNEVYEILNSGRVDAVKAGTRTLIVVDSLRRYLLNLPRYVTSTAPRGARAMIAARKEAANRSKRVVPHP